MIKKIIDLMVMKINQKLKVKQITVVLLMLLASYICPLLEKTKAKLMLVEIYKVHNGIKVLFIIVMMIEMETTMRTN